MPIQAQSKPMRKETISQFRGVDLRSDEEMIPPGGLRQGLNIDLYERPGTVMSRLGFAKIVNGLDRPHRVLLRTGENLVSGGATIVYFNQTSVLENLDASTRMAMREFRSLNADAPETFIANGANRKRLSSIGVASEWGIPAPKTAPGSVSLVGSGSLTGTYSLVVTFARKQGGTVLHESNPSPPIDTVTPSNEDIQFIVQTPDDIPDLTHIRVYRTVTTGTTYLFDQDVEITTLGSPETIVSSQSDGGLGTAVDEDNDRPPSATLIAVLRDRLWLNNIDVDSRLHYSKRFFPESFPSTNFVDIGSDEQNIKAIESFGGALVVFTDKTKFRVIETLADVTAIGDGIPFIGAASTDFTVVEIQSSRGCIAPSSVVPTGFGIIYLARDGVYLTDGQSANERLLSREIQGLFSGIQVEDIAPIDYQFAENITGEYYRGRYFFSYTSTAASNGFNDTTVVLDVEAGTWWFIDQGLQYLLAAKDENILYAGRSDGDIDYIENEDRTKDFTTSTIDGSIITPTMTCGDGMMKKQFFYLRVDATVATGDTVTATLSVDNVAIKTYTITGTRTRQLLRIPRNTRGNTWKVSIDFSASQRVLIHGMEIQYKSLSNS